MDMTILGIGIVMTFVFTYIFSFVNLSAFQYIALTIGGIVGSVIAAVIYDNE